MRRGEVYFVDFGKDKTTHKQCGIRPAVIVSNNRGNGHGPTVTVVPLTGNIHKRPEMPTHVQIPLSSCIGLKRPSMALAEQVDTVDKITIHHSSCLPPYGMQVLLLQSHPKHRLSVLFPLPA